MSDDAGTTKEARTAYVLGHAVSPFTGRQLVNSIRPAAGTVEIAVFGHTYKITVEETS